MARADATELGGTDPRALVRAVEEALAAAGLGFGTHVEVDGAGGITVSTIEDHREAEDPTPYDEALRRALAEARRGN
jgi:hypothetical protein